MAERGGGSRGDPNQKIQMIERLKFADFIILQEAALEVANRNPLLYPCRQQIQLMVDLVREDYSTNQLTQEIYDGLVKYLRSCINSSLERGCSC